LLSSANADTILLEAVGRGKHLKLSVFYSSEQIKPGGRARADPQVAVESSKMWKMASLLKPSRRP
jgi:hypothetical protein